MSDLVVGSPGASRLITGAVYLLPRQSGRGKRTTETHTHTRDTGYRIPASGPDWQAELVETCDVYVFPGDEWLGVGVGVGVVSPGIVLSGTTRKGLNKQSSLQKCLGFSCPTNNARCGFHKILPPFFPGVVMMTAACLSSRPIPVGFRVAPPSLSSSSRDKKQGPGGSGWWVVWYIPARCSIASPVLGRFPCLFRMRAWMSWVRPRRNSGGADAS